MKEKRVNVGKVAFWTVYILLMAGLGAFVGYFASGWWGWALLLVIVVACVFLVEWMSKKLWPKPGQEKPADPLVKRIIRTVIQCLMGGTFGGGLVGLIFALLHGWNVLPFLGLLAVSVALLVVLLTVKPVQDQEMKDEMDTLKKEIKHYDKDERLHAIGFKTGYLCFGVTLYLFLLFGAFLAEFPPENFNVIPVGVLGILGVATLLYLIVFNLYDSEKLDIEKRGCDGGIVTLLISVVPVILMGARWVMTGLTNMGLVFLVVFVLVLILQVVEVWMKRKYR